MVGSQRQRLFFSSGRGCDNEEFGERGEGGRNVRRALLSGAGWPVSFEFWWWT